MEIFLCGAVAQAALLAQMGDDWARGMAVLQTALA
jgi:hypothetical protein